MQCALSTTLRHPELVSGSTAHHAQVSQERVQRRPTRAIKQPTLRTSKWILEAELCLHKRVQDDDDRSGLPVDRPESQSDCQIMPVRVVLLDQVDFPLPVPAFELLLTQDRAFHVAEHLEPDQSMDAVLAGEPASDALAMLVKSPHQVAGDADVERPARLARKDIDARVALESHSAESAGGWTLKQVQGDGYIENRSPTRHAELGSASIYQPPRSLTA